MGSKQIWSLLSLTEKNNLSDFQEFHKNFTNLKHLEKDSSKWSVFQIPSKFPFPITWPVYLFPTQLWVGSLSDLAICSDLFHLVLLWVAVPIWASWASPTHPWSAR